MKNRKLLLIVSLVLAMTMSLGGTLAYLSDTDADVNTMVLGNVDIEQHEYERAIDENGDYVTYEETEREGNPTGYQLKEYTQDKPLLPAVGAVSGTPENDWDDTRVYFAQLPDDSNMGTMQVLAGIENIQDKFVFVENTGKTDAYVRTLIAYEAGTMDKAKWEDLVVTSANSFWKETELEEIVTINGNNYVVVEFLYDGNQYPEGGTMVEGANGKHDDGIVHPGEYTYCNLSQIYLMPEATNEDMIALDGNGNDRFDILVLSQAIQADGFADAVTALNEGFGEFNAANVKSWFEGEEEVNKLPKIVTSDEELAEEIKAGKTDIKLAAGTFHMPAAAKGKTLTLTGAGAGTIIEVVPGGQGEANGQLDYNLDGSTVTFNNLTIKTNNQTYAGYARLKATYNNCVMDQCYCLNDVSEFNGCTFNVAGDQYNLWTWGAPTATLNDCTFNSDGKAVLLYGTADTKLTLNNCVFNDTGVLTALKAAIEIGDDYGKSYELIVNNTTVNGYEINDTGIDTGSTLWGNKNSMSSDKLNVVIDGVDVY